MFTVPIVCRIVEDIGCCIVGQTRNIAPCDKKLYAIRDVTATVNSNPLIIGKNKRPFSRMKISLIRVFKL